MGTGCGRALSKVLSSIGHATVLPLWRPPSCTGLRFLGVRARVELPSGETARSLINVRTTLSARDRPVSSTWLSSILLFPVLVRCRERWPACPVGTSPRALAGGDGVPPACRPGRAMEMRPPGNQLPPARAVEGASVVDSAAVGACRRPGAGHRRMSLSAPDLVRGSPAPELDRCRGGCCARPPLSVSGWGTSRSSMRSLDPGSMAQST
mmetsp:Transcript_32087/g.83191  ORF Transcript_32087/g.83191 Transcript_32087/m.83191 type:complete len:209 (-) Transcript_32087:30-656(-)